MTSISDNDLKLQLILEDLALLLKNERIESTQISNIEQQLKSPEAKKYLANLCALSKPEEALSDAFFKGNSVLSQYLSPHVSPEVNVNPGFIDFKVGTGRKSFLLELKPLFDQEITTDDGQRRVKALKQNKLSWEDHEAQIKKYLHKESEYVVITNLKDWLFFNDKITVGKLAPFYKTDLFQFTTDYKINHDPIDYLERAKSQYSRGELDKEFLHSLNSWVKIFLEVQYDLDDEKRDALIIGLINKFIFIQTLDDYRVIDFQWLRHSWSSVKTKWENKGKFKILEEFINEFMKWFDGYYDTELFSGKILECVKNTSDNIEKFYDSIIAVLGLEYFTSLTDSKGILQYDFRNINEDIFGKAYETFLANRHDEAIYYTPSFVSEFIVENTVEQYFKDVIDRIKQEILEQNFSDAKKSIDKLISIKILDPSCGSGSFLVKTLKLLFDMYLDLGNYLLNEKRKVSNHSQSNSQNEVKKKIDELIETLKTQNTVELLSAIILRHLYGNDLDSKALEVARINLWLEAIKLAPDKFTPSKLPNNSNKVLPHFDINLINGNSVVGMPTEQCLSILQKHPEEIIEMSKLRLEYITQNQEPENLHKIETIKSDLRKIVDLEYEKYLTQSKIPIEIISKTKVLHWTLEFWFMYFDSNGKILNEEYRGVDCLIGNPPYKSIQIIKKNDPTFSTFLEKSGFTSATGSFDLAAIFVEKSYTLLNKVGKFGFILTNTFFGANYGIGLRKFLSTEKAVSCIVNFGDQQVFTDASTYTAILFMNKNILKNFHYAIVKKLNRTKEQLTKVLLDDYSDSDITCGIISEDTLSDKRWAFIFKNEEAVIQKLQSIPDTLDTISERIAVGLQTSADDIYILEKEEVQGSLTKVYSKELKSSVLLESKILEKFVKGSLDIKLCDLSYSNRLIIFPYKKTTDGFKIYSLKEMTDEFPKCFEYLKKFEDSLKKRADCKVEWWGHTYPRNLDIFDKAKIMTPFNAFEPSFAYDSVGYCYTTGIAGGYGIIVKPSYNMDPYYLIGLLNSTLLGRYMVTKGGGTLRGGYISYEDRFIKELPVVIPTSEIELITSEIAKLTKSIEELKKARKQFLEKWREIAPKIKTHDFTLLEMLEKDESYLQEGASSRWFDEVSFYPHKDKKNSILEQPFNVFRLFTDNEKLIVKIQGIDVDNLSTTVFEFRFKDEHLMQNVYLSLSDLLSSRMSTKTLNQIFEKTKIPTIGPNPNNTVNIIKQTIEKLNQKSEKSKPGLFDLNVKFEDMANEIILKEIPPNILGIDSKISDNICKIDANVFKIYGLGKSEINKVLGVTGTDSLKEGKILEFFDQL